MGGVVTRGTGRRGDVSAPGAAAGVLPPADERQVGVHQGAGQGLRVGREREPPPAGCTGAATRHHSVHHHPRLLDDHGLMLAYGGVVVVCMCRVCGCVGGLGGGYRS